MKQTTSRAVRDGLQYVSLTYGFMLERGYEIISAGDAEVGWRIVLRKADLLVQILRTRGDDYVSFRSSSQPADEFTEIRSVVYAATGVKLPFAGSDAKVLQAYLDRIEDYFAEQHARDPDRLRAARDEYRASLPRVAPALPKKPKRIPILYYPLLALVLLLLFGALATLYMVLLDRLFAALSPGAGPDALLTGPVAVLLAVGTLLLLRKWIKMD